MKKLPILAIVTFGVPKIKVHPHLVNFPSLKKALDEHECHYLHFRDDIGINEMRTAQRLQYLHSQEPSAVLVVSGHPLDATQSDMEETTSRFRARFPDASVNGLFIDDSNKAVML